MASNPELLTPEDATHDVTLSQSGKYFVDSFSKPDDAAGHGAARHQRQAADDPREGGRLEAGGDGWHPPTPIVVKARDDQTDLYGLMYKPSTFDPSKKYPIVNHIYPGPQTGSVGGRTFSAARGDAQALAELGFIVVEIDGMGTPWRSKKFHEAYFGNMGDNTLPDQVGAMKQLAKKYPWIDIDRAGSTGTRAAATPRPTRCSAIPTSSRWASPSRATTTIASTRTTGPRSGRAS